MPLLDMEIDSHVQEWFKIVEWLFLKWGSRPTRPVTGQKLCFVLRPEYCEVKPIFVELYGGVSFSIPITWICLR